MPAAIIIGAVASAGIGAYGAYAASKQQAGAAQNALDFQQKVYKQTQQNAQPWINTGMGANATLAGLYGIDPKTGKATGAFGNYDSFFNSPDYEFARQQGELGLTRYLNATGQTMSGGAAREMSQFQQGLASQNYGNWYNRMFGMSQAGNQAQQALAGANTAQAGQIGNSMQAIGQAQAAGTVGMANAAIGGINSGVNNYLGYGLAQQYMNKMPAGSASAYAPSFGLPNYGGMPSAPANQLGAWGQGARPMYMPQAYSMWSSG